MKNGENDIDSLARMVAEGFKSMDKRFDGLEGRMDGLDGRMEGLEGRMGTLEKEVRLTNQHIDRVVMPALDAHASRIKDLEVHTGIHG